MLVVRSFCISRPCGAGDWATASMTYSDPYCDRWYGAFRVDWHCCFGRLPSKRGPIAFLTWAFGVSGKRSAPGQEVSERAHRGRAACLRGVAHGARFGPLRASLLMTCEAARGPA